MNYQMSKSCDKEDVTVKQETQKSAVLCSTHWASCVVLVETVLQDNVLHNHGGEKKHGGHNTNQCKEYQHKCLPQSLTQLLFS